MPQNFDPLSRRRFLSATAGAALCGLATRGHAQGGSELPTTGLEVPQAASFDRMMRETLGKGKIPGGSVAVMGNGRLLFARGYGWADAAKTKPVEPNSLFRIASISKLFTAAAILRLVEQGKLGLDESAWAVHDVDPLRGQSMDARLQSVTIRHLLGHTAGWDLSEGRGSAPFYGYGDRRIAREVGKPMPTEAGDIVRFIAGQPLQHEPGTRYAYSNLGYLVLGRVIEKISGQSYEQFVQREVLLPAGVRRARVGRTRLDEREADEVSYFDRPGARRAASVVERGKEVAWPDGGFFMGARDSSSGWIATPVDLLRFVRAVDPSTPEVLGASRRLLSRETVAQMTTRPALAEWQGSAWFHGLGWRVRPRGESLNWWHTGGMPGTCGVVLRLGMGLSFAALFNLWPSEGFTDDVDSDLVRAAREVTSWPRHDLFARFP